MSEQPDLFRCGLAEASARECVGAALSIADSGVALEVADLREAEILARILRHCLPIAANADATATALLARFGCIGRIVGACTPDLAEVVGADAAHEFQLLHALLVRSLAFPLRRGCVLSSSSAVKAYLQAELAAAPREAFHVLFLDKANQLIADERMGEGTIDHAPVYPREVMRRALELSASALCLVHNHPSGGANPSSADIEMTRRVVDAGRALGIAVHDHFLVAGDQLVSFKTLGVM